MTLPAYELNGAPCTREKFYAVACDPRRSVVVEACAGAGKTWMLVSRILRALLEPATDGRAVQPQDILAITFTRKAAGEMRQRLHEWLEQFAHAPVEDLQKELMSRGLSPQRALDLHEQLQSLHQCLLDQGRSVQIRTFHSWFAALLRTAPLGLLDHLGLPAQHELLEDDADARAELWRRFLRTLWGEQALQADYTALVRQLGRHSAHEALNAALDKRVEFARADAAGVLDGAVPTAGQWFSRFAGFAQPRDAWLSSERGRTLLQAAASAMLGGTPSVAAQGQRLQQALALPASEQAWAAVQAELLTKAGAARKVSDKLAGRDAVCAAQDEVLAVLAAEGQQAGHDFHWRMVRLVRRLTAEFADLKRERGWVDMGDLETAALALLADPVLSGWVQERLDHQVRHLLIDEFQDTNPLQWQALHAWLSGYAGAGGGGGLSVFIVGDPKQSIYRFRRADPQVFAAARDFVCQALGGDALSSDHTRRNAPALIDAVNTVLGQAQQAGAFAGFRSHTTESEVAGELLALPVVPRPAKDAQADSGDADDDDDGDAPDLPPWRDSLSTPRTELEETLRTLECRQAAQWIATQIAAGAAPQSIMVLCRRRQPLGLLQRELRSLGIAADQPEALSLGELPAAQDVVALVDALVSPGHDWSLARALKSPLFGLSDAQLATIAQAARATKGADGASRPPRPWLEVLLNQEQPALADIAPSADLMQYQQWLGQLPPHDALQAIYHHRDVLARYAAAAPVAEREHHVLQLRALLTAALQVGGGRFLTAYQWVRALRHQTLPVPQPVNPHAVQLLTVHGAKGLEADTVLLLDTQSGSTPARGPAVLIDWPGESDAPRSLSFLSSEKSAPPSAQDVLTTEVAARAREELNALYVAITRAKRRLVISSFAPHRNSDSAWWPRLQPLCKPVDSLADVLESALMADGAWKAQARQGGTEFSWKKLPPSPVYKATDAIKSEATLKAGATTTDATRLGEAMHWLLEHASDTPQGWRPERLRQARRRWALDGALAEQAERLARRIFTGEAAWAWSPDEVLQAFDEIELTHQGQRLRIDRLVRRRAVAAAPESWWVLDYKSAAQPERNPDLLAQLARYRSAIEQLHPGEVVRAALLGGDGRMSLVE
ncbi:UvrD-helicase domain-containing protein [Ottowia sp.]|uniref:UvrD-helicase domain-containing protein n=1 Tax=Ottowia sp. TaxID=1898956 RepID=UPI003A853458